MKRTRLILVVASMLLLCAIAVNLCGCSAKIQAKDLMAGIEPNNVSVSADFRDRGAGVTDFAVRLFQASEKEGENTLISPLSVICALAMVLNGAEGETKAQMEATLGMSAEELNLYIYSYMSTLPEDDKKELSIANSIWFTDDDRFEVNKDFLQVNADYYGADIYEAPFDDSMLKDINTWVKEETDGMIPKILDEIPDSAIMYLVNALAFDAKWETEYERNRLKDGKFTKEDGTKQNAEFMYSTEFGYFDDGNATGFIKYYKGMRYAFVAMLPNEDVSLSEYVESLDGAGLHAMLSEPQKESVRVSMPKFETEYDAEMSEILSSMGMTDAFESSEADFSGLGTSTDGNIFIEKVVHKTYISVDENGTKAGAATLIGMNDGAASIEERQVYLNRPFVYMLVDCLTDTPFFIGTMTDVKN